MSSSTSTSRLSPVDPSPDSSSCPRQLLRAYFRSSGDKREVYELDPPPFGTSAENPGTLDLSLYRLERPEALHFSPEFSFTCAKSLNLKNRVVDDLPRRDVRVGTGYVGLMLNTSKITQYSLSPPKRPSSGDQRPFSKQCWYM